MPVNKTMALLPTVTMVILSTTVLLHRGHFFLVVRGEEGDCGRYTDWKRKVGTTNTREYAGLEATR